MAKKFIGSANFIAGIAAIELKKGKESARTAAPVTGVKTSTEMFKPWEPEA